uniref:Uncharacterized protein n=1 Tax=Anguilla anguilla TaxID=7936 RepID=A0A0E9SGM7_ANGAN
MKTQLPTATLLITHLSQAISTWVKHDFNQVNVMLFWLLKCSFR